VTQHQDIQPMHEAPPTQERSFAPAAMTTDHQIMSAPVTPMTEHRDYANNASQPSAPRDAEPMRETQNTASSDNVIILPGPIAEQTSAPSSGSTEQPQAQHPNAERKPRYPANQRRRKRFSKNRQRRPEGSEADKPNPHAVEGEDIYSSKPPKDGNE
jgi:hypothetical protein